MLGKAVEQVTGLTENVDFLVCGDGSNCWIEYEVEGDWPTYADVLAQIEATPDLLQPYRDEAIAIVTEQAGEAEQSLDNLLGGSVVRMVMLNTEIVEYFNQGRPADPSPSVFVIADAMATRRGITLREMLEILFNRWRNVQADIAAITNELDRLTEAINDAASLAEIQTAVRSASWPARE